MTLFNLATCFYDLYDIEKAIFYYSELEKGKVKDSRVFFNLAVCFEKINNTDNAMIYYDKVFFHFLYLWIIK